MRQFRFYILFLVIGIFPVAVNAQYYDDDAGFWLYLKVDKDITKKLNAQFTMQNRFENNLSEYSQINGNIELTYKLNKHFRLVGGYVYGFKKNIEGFYGDRQQAYAGFVLRKRFKSFLFSYRNIFQGQVKNVNSSEKGAVPVFFDRNKFSVKYEINKRVEVMLADEINLSYNQSNFDNIARNRAFAEVYYNLSSKSYIATYFMFQQHYRFKGQPKRDFIFGLTYSHSF